MSLNTYRNKRLFDQTPEPKGNIKPTKHRPVFVVQKHHASHLHYDFRLEVNGVLKSWAVPKGPSLNPQDKRLAMMVEDHPYEYKDFEGTIPKGNYGAGEVIIWDEGTYEPLSMDFEKGDVKFILHGHKLKGEFVLAKIKKSQDNSWLLIKKKDSSAIDVRDLHQEKFPSFIKPMLATPVDEAFDDQGWIFEIKWDGYRVLAFIKSDNDKPKTKSKVKLYSRNEILLNQKYPSIAEELSKITHNVVLDGEIAALDEKGKNQFQLLQNYSKDNVQLVYYVFDILHLNGRSTCNLPLIQRKKLLETLNLSRDIIRISEHIEKEGQEFFKAAVKEKLEGIIAKNSSSTYLPGKRSRDWLKIKIHQRQEAVIAGITEPRKSRKHFGALVLGIYDNGNLVYIGHTGGGFNDKSLAEVYQKLKPYFTKESPFKIPPKTNAPVQWVKPKFIAEVKFREWTSDNHMRQPIFLGMRTDKDARTVTREQTQPARKVLKEHKQTKHSPREVFTNLDKIFWPKESYTKNAVIQYYDKISEFILPYLKDRPENLNRHPNGIEGKSFYHKDIFDIAKDWMQTVVIHSDTENRDLEYLVCNDKDTLLYMANLGCIEINPWNSRVQNLDNPDFAILDLDPLEISFDKVVECAQVIHQTLESVDVPCYAKTSGSKGMHICIPLAAKYNYDQTKLFAEIIANIIHKKLPNWTSVERSPSKRQKKLYIDFLQNRRGQTLAAPYSLRPRPKASVSTPLKWSEVKQGLDPTKFNIKTIFKRLARVGDLWQPVLDKKVDLEKALENLEKMLK